MTVEGEQQAVKICGGLSEEESGGRYLVAARDLTAGEVVLSEPPLVAGPIYTRTRPVCLECLRLVGPQEGHVPCSGCGFPLCGPACEAGTRHSLECPVFQAAGFKPDITDWSGPCPIYSCITVLRFLLLRDTNPAAWAVLDSLMDHEAERAVKDSPAWRVHELIVVKFVVGNLGLDQFSHKDIRRAIGILRTNSVKLETRGECGEGVAVYPTYSFANHRCICNTYTRKYRDLRLELIAQTDIKKGEVIWTRYTTPQLGNYQRIADIQRTWHFTCTCPRCQDPTEFGSMMSGLICSANCPGILLPRLPTLIGSPWCCTSCSRNLGISAVQTIIKSVTDDIKDARDGSNEELLALVEKHAGHTLHRNHYLLIGIKEIVLQRLMRTVSQSGEMEKLDNVEQARILRLRTSIFQDIVSVLERVDSPGAPWREKLAKIQAEETYKLQHIPI